MARGKEQSGGYTVTTLVRLNENIDSGQANSFFQDLRSEMKRWLDSQDKIVDSHEIDLPTAAAAGKTVGR